MTGSSFDGMTRHLGRRHALQPLGLAALAVAGGSSLASAKKGKSNGQRNRKRKKKKLARQKEAIRQQALARCASQIPACEAEIRRACDNGPNCLSLALPCCQPLQTCDFTTFFVCADEELSKL
jgi:hypothetical protein